MCLKRLDYKFKEGIFCVLILVLFGFTSCEQDVETNHKTSTLEEKLYRLQATLQEKDTLTETEYRQLQELISQNQNKVARVEIQEPNRSFNYDDLGKDRIEYNAVDEPPVFPGCENNSVSCFTQQMSKFIIENFDKHRVDNVSLAGDNIIEMSFVIDKNGEIQEVKARGAYPDLEKEAQRVIKSLPNMTPGMEKGKLVNVLYSLPIVYRV